MTRIVSFSVAVALVFVLMGFGSGAGLAHAESGAGWTGEYFTNRDLTGAATFVRLDDRIDFDWMADSPVPGIIPADGFSVRWTGSQTFGAGTYRFTAIADDGVRVFVDEQVVIDAWRDQTAATITGEITLTAGDHFVRVEYYDAVDQARIAVSWDLVGSERPSGGWAAEYYNNTDLAAPQAGGRLEDTLEYNWGLGSPIPGVVNADGFSARWWSFPNLEAGEYVFSAWADDGVRVYVDSTLIIDAWTPAIYQEHQGAMTFTETGQHTVRVEYFEATDQARVNVYWLRAGAAPDVPTAPLPAPAPSTVTATITTPALNVRTGPSTGWSILTRVREFETYTVIGSNGNRSWWQISGPGFTGWVSGSYIAFNNDNSAVPVTDGGSSSTTTTPTGILQARSNASLRVRTGPGTTSRRVTALGFGQTATVIGRNADSSWLQIRLTDGAEGWVSASYVTLVGDVPLGNIPVTG